jgi:hypothetical protein
MAADAWVFHDEYKEFMGDSTIDMDGDVFEMRLYLSTSNIATTSVGDATTATNEVSGSGYAADVLATTWTESAGTVTWDSDDGAFTASGGSITARFAAIIDTTTTPDQVVCHSLLDNAPADVVVTDGNTLTVEINASGINTLI